MASLGVSQKILTIGGGGVVWRHAPPARIEFPGAIYHVLAGGNRRAEIFSEDRDRARFLKWLGDTRVRLGWEVRAWVLMGNHYHLALHTPEANLVEGMKWLQNAYSHYFNTERTGRSLAKASATPSATFAPPAPNRGYKARRQAFRWRKPAR